MPSVCITKGPGTTYIQANAWEIILYRLGFVTAIYT